MREYRCPLGSIALPEDMGYSLCSESACAWYVFDKRACALKVLAERTIKLKISDEESEVNHDTAKG